MSEMNHGVVDAVALAARWRRVRDRVERACASAGRGPNSVRLIAVSKFHPAAAIRALYAVGQREFGENYAQALVAKREELADLPELRFRMIGHLQRNKVRQVVHTHTTVDSVDSAALGAALSKRASEAGLMLPVLVQVNIGEEPQKAGAMPAELPLLLSELAELPALRVTGLMAIPPDGHGHPEKVRPHFRRLAQLANQHRLPELSMGMSEDLEVAVSEGATMVRVGTAIFGPRLEGDARLS